MAEDFGLCNEENYHKQKLYFFLHSMRCFKDELKSDGYKVFYNHLDIRNRDKRYIDILDAYLKDNNFKKITALPGKQSKQLLLRRINKILNKKGAKSSF